MARNGRDPLRVISTQVQRWRGAEVLDDNDEVVAEEPLEVRVDGVPLAVIMRTPGHDAELALGFLYGEGIVASREDIADVLVWRDEEGRFAHNRVTVRLAANAHGDLDNAGRRFYATSSCGVCGKASIEAVLAMAPPLPRREAPPATVLYTLPERMRAAQTVFDRTGGLHAAALFTFDGEIVAVREDVGRHNAVDKLIGRSLLDGALPLTGRILMLSGRCSFEIVQKALLARISAIAAVSAPSSLAIEAARRGNIALAGFVRDGRFNFYA